MCGASEKITGHGGRLDGSGPPHAVGCNYMCMLISLLLDGEILNVCYIILLTMYLTHCVWS